MSLPERIWGRVVPAALCLMLIPSIVEAAESLLYHSLTEGIVSGGEQASAPLYRLSRSCLGEVIANDVRSPLATLTEGVFVVQNQLEHLLPHQAPTINPVTPPTAVASQTLSGMKASDTSLWLNDVQIGAVSASTTWSHTLSLVHGTNVLRLFTKDLHGNASATITTAIVLDTTPPTTPVVRDDGLFTSTLTHLHATWSSADPETGIMAYEYAIGTSPGATDVVAPTALPSTQPELTQSPLALRQGVRYYFAVRAKNGLGTWSAWGSSDGIFANQHLPVVLGITPASPTKLLEGKAAMLAASASDPDADPLEYQCSVSGKLLQTWTTHSQWRWTPQAADFGLKTLLVEVRDPYGGKASRQSEVFVLRRPVLPPSP